jgi:hypothetical protein
VGRDDDADGRGREIFVRHPQRGQRPEQAVSQQQETHSEKNGAERPHNFHHTPYSRRV